MDKKYTHPNRYLIPPNFDFGKLLETAKPEIRKGSFLSLKVYMQSLQFYMKGSMLSKTGMQKMTTLR